MDETYYTVKVAQNGMDSYNFLQDQLQNDARTSTPEHLQNNSRSAALVKLPFQFPFYGHNISR